MKHYYLLPLFWLSALLAQAQTVPAGLLVVSRESSVVNGQLTFQVKAVALEAGQASYNLQVTPSASFVAASGARHHGAQPNRSGRGYPAGIRDGAV